MTKYSPPDPELDAILGKLFPVTQALIEAVKARPRGTVTLKTGELFDAVDQAEETLEPLARLLGIFQRGGELVRVISLPEVRESGGLKRPAGTVMLHPLSAASLTETFERYAIFERFNKKKELVSCDCPPRLATTYLSRCGQWKMPILAGIIGAPLMRKDGSILSKCGYDEETGLYLVSNEDWPQVPNWPTREDALAALELLKKPFSQFPFVHKAAEAVQIAAILAAIQRRVLEACPLTATSAPTMRSGKTMLNEGTAIIATGKPAAAASASPDREEFRKAITSALREGHAIINLDNIEGILHSPDLARAITQPEFADRLLGKSEMLHLPTNVLWTASGNNLTVRGDLVSRTLVCRIDASVEKPEERRFEIPNLKEYIAEHRPQLVTAALTILRAYHVAGRPRQNVKPWGGFDDWSASIREPLVWLGMADPCETREDVAADDPEKETTSALLVALDKQFPFPFDEFTMKEVMNKATKRDSSSDGKPGAFSYPDLHAAVAGVATRKGVLDVFHLGAWAKKNRDKFVDGLRIIKVGDYKRVNWRIAKLDSKPSREPGDESEV